MKDYIPKRSEVDFYLAFIVCGLPYSTSKQINIVQTGVCLKKKLNTLLHAWYFSFCMLCQNATNIYKWIGLVLILRFFNDVIKILTIYDVAEHWNNMLSNTSLEVWSKCECVITYIHRKSNSTIYEELCT